MEGLIRSLSLMVGGLHPSSTRMIGWLALCVALLTAGEVAAAPLNVVGRFLQDTHGNNILMRGVNVPVYKSGWADDLNAVAAAIALTKTNVVRLEWWAVPPGGTTEYTLANLDRAIQKFYDLGIIPVVELHDLTYQYGTDDPPGGANPQGNDRVLFANTITAFWTSADVLAVLVKHQDHLVINIANEWGSSYYSDGTPTTTNFIANYSAAITAMRNAGIIAPLMVDAPKGFEYQFLLDHGAALLAVDPQSNTMLSFHAYWAFSDAAYSDANVDTILDNFKNSGLPVVIGEASSNAWTTIQCDPIHYPNLLTHANTNAIGYLFWAWYEDGQCGQDMNITVGPNSDGVTLPTLAGYGYDALYGASFGIDTAQPATLKADFSPVNVPALLNTSFDYNVTSTNDGATRAATAQVTRLNNFGAEKRPVVVLMPGWGGSGDVAAAQDAQAIMFANNGYVALNIGFHQTSNVPVGALVAWYSDLAESAKAALDTVCAQSYADCSAVVITGESYGGTQAHPVLRYLRANSVYDGSSGANAGRKVWGILGQDSGYTQYWADPKDADATAYSIAMIQNLGDTTFPVDSCDWGNCGARNRADYHQTSPGSQYVLSYCPAGGEHGTRGYADWDAWVLSAVKTMLHSQRGVPKFTGYVEPTIPVSNACLTAPVSPSAPTIGTATAGNASISVSFTPGALGSGTLVNYTADCGGVTNTGASSPIVVSGLTNGTTYTCKVKTSSSVADSPWSVDSNSVTPSASVTVPRAPTSASANAGNAQASVNFTAPSSDGGSAITGYTAAANPGGQTGTCTGAIACTITVTGLTNGTAYTFAVTATNPVGSSSASSASNSVTPRASQTIGAISFNPTKLTVGGTTTASATATSSLAVTFSSTSQSICTVNGTTVTGVAAGTCTVAADQAGNGTYSAAPQVTQNITVTPSSSRLINLSTRGQVQTGNNVMIGGFIIGGSTPKKVLVRAVGPNLANYGVSGVLANPMLELHRSSDGSIIGSNDDWGSASNVAAIQATGLAPVNSLESAILATLDPGAYTAIVSGNGGGTGVGIVEVYELDHPEIPLINISTRGQVQTGNNVMIGGFIIQGDSFQTVLIRAVGPNLANYGVTGVLADPMLELHRSSDGAIIASNDNWVDAANAAAIQATGLAPVSPFESAILITLPPGAYTAIVSGANGGTGVGIVEVFAQ